MNSRNDMMENGEQVITKGEKNGFQPKISSPLKIATRRKCMHSSEKEETKSG